MSTSAMNRAIRRGIRRGLAMQSGDISSTQKMRDRIRNRDYIGETWTDVGTAISQAVYTQDQRRSTPKPGKA